MSTQFIEIRYGSLIDTRQRLEWLSSHGVQAARIANFGCSLGYDTLALAWWFNASEVVGIDKDEDTIFQARGDLDSLRDALREVEKQTRFHAGMFSQDFLSWWQSEAGSFRQQLTEAYIEFVCSDFTQPTDLPSDYYDLTYCDFVLNHIWITDAGKPIRANTLSGIREMARVVRPGGFVAARELARLPDGEEIELRPYFEQAGLNVTYEHEDGMVRLYLCRKPDRP